MPSWVILSIAHVDCDAFYAAVEKRDDPSLKAVPLIVGGRSGRGVVTTACYIARQYGVRSAMPMFRAMELCPAATVVVPDMAKYKRVSAGIREIFRAATPMIEPISLDEAYLDLGAEHRVAAEAPAQALAIIASRVEQEIGITVSIGLSYNKFLAKLASDMRKPRGYAVIGRGEAVALLAGMPVSRIHGVGEVTARRLSADGIRLIGQLQQMSEAELVGRYGKFGRQLASYSRGVDEREVRPHREAKSLSAETTFRRDTASARELIEAAMPLCERVEAQLARKGLAGATVVLKLKTTDFQLLTRHKRLAQPTRRASVMVEVVRGLIEKEATGESFRLIGVGVETAGAGERGRSAGLVRRRDFYRLTWQSMGPVKFLPWDHRPLWSGRDTSAPP